LRSKKAADVGERIKTCRSRREKEGMENKQERTVKRKTSRGAEPWEWRIGKAELSHAKNKKKGEEETESTGEGRKFHFQNGLRDQRERKP